MKIFSMCNLAAFRRDRRGVAALETAFAFGFVLLPLCLGMSDLATEIRATMRLDSALQSAVFYVWANQGTFTAAGIQSAAQAGYGAEAPTLTVTSSTACSCVTFYYLPASGIACTGTCPLLQTRAAYTTVTASISLTLPAPLPPLISPAALSVRGTVRTQ
jgi:Flp pilus assembly protein TadG